jgi:transcriptional regulator GlxA family with amidase domain
LRKAKELLALSTLSVHEVAREAGFADPLHFSRAFSARVGLSPRGFRRAQARGPQT